MNGQGRDTWLQVTWAIDPMPGKTPRAEADAFNHRGAYYHLATN